MGTKLDRIREMSATNPKMVFTSLYHLINVELLRQCHKELDGKKATGVDNVTKAEYEVNLEENLQDLVDRLKRRNYWFKVGHRTASKKQRTKLKAMNLWLKQNRTLRVRDLIYALNRKLRGHYQYYGITGNADSIADFLYYTDRMLFKWLNRRSQRRSYSWEGYGELKKVFPLARPKIHFKLYS